MTFPTVIEIPPRLEPLTADPFAVVVAGDQRPLLPAPGPGVRRRIVD